VLQEAVATILADPATPALVARAAAIYAERRAALIDALARHGIAAHGRSGLNVWVPVPEELTVTQFMLDAGWAISAGGRYRLRGAPAIRISIATLRPAEAERLAGDLARSLATDRRGHYA
jgi:DNA-binding transcriptional MocR family regulator